MGADVWVLYSDRGDVQNRDCRRECCGRPNSPKPRLRRIISPRAMQADTPTKWKSNLTAAAVAQFLCIVGWNASIPFLPLYVRELGVTDLHQVELWSGLLAACGSAASFLVFPFWGALSDRMGHKWNTIRAALGIAVTFAAMALVGSVQELFVARVFQGALAGITPAFFALTSAFVPLERVGFALGVIQMASSAGGAVGPLVGGAVADLVGYRWAFAVSGLLSAAGAAVVFVSVRDRFRRPAPAPRSNGVVEGDRFVAHSLPVLGAILIMASANLADSVARVILPLFVDFLRRDPAGVNAATGLVLAGAATAGALSALVMGRLADRFGYRRILLACAAGAALSYGAQALAPTFGVFLAASLAMGLFVGGIVPAANAVLARTVGREQRGAVYGLSASANSAGNTLGPMLGAALASAWGMRSSFAASAVLSLAGAALVARLVRPAEHPRAARLYHLGLHLPDSFLRLLHMPRAAGSHAQVDENREKKYNVGEGPPG